MMLNNEEMGKAVFRSIQECKGKKGRFNTELFNSKMNELVYHGVDREKIPDKKTVSKIQDCINAYSIKLANMHYTGKLNFSRDKYLITKFMVATKEFISGILNLVASLVKFTAALGVGAVSFMLLPNPATTSIGLVGMGVSFLMVGSMSEKGYKEETPEDIELEIFKYIKKSQVEIVKAVEDKIKQEVIMGSSYDRPAEQQASAVARAASFTADVEPFTPTSPLPPENPMYSSAIGDKHHREDVSNASTKDETQQHDLRKQSFADTLTANREHSKNIDIEKG